MNTSRPLVWLAALPLLCACGGRPGEAPMETLSRQLREMGSAVRGSPTDAAKPDAKPAPASRGKCAAIPLSSTALPPEVAAVMDEILLAELQKGGFEAIGQDDVKTLLGFEQQKAVLGCEDASCFVEIGNALGVEYIVAGKLAQVEGSLLLSLKLLDVKKAKVLKRAARQTTEGQAALPKLIAGAVQDLAPDAAP